MIRRFALAADGLAVAVVVSLPWSTSLTGILIVPWLVAVAVTFDLPATRREIMSVAGGLPVLLWILAALGTLWAGVDWGERLAGLGAFHKLLVIPLLLAQFRRSGRGQLVVLGFFASGVVLLAVSWALVLTPGLTWRGGMNGVGVPLKDYLTQSGMFALCTFGLLYEAVEHWRTRRTLALGLLALALLFLVNILYVATGRTTIVVIAFLFLLLAGRQLALRQFNWRGLISALLIGGVLSGVAWMSSPYLRYRMGGLWTEIRTFPATAHETSAGLRLGFWHGSIDIIAQAPFVGHGTGTIRAQFVRIAQQEPGVSVTQNPHNQLFAIAIQLGAIGVVALILMWIAHVAMFGTVTAVSWFGLIAVVQNVVGSLFNSHISDFTQGWLYVFAVGVLGGMVLHGRDAIDVESGKSLPDGGACEAHRRQVEMA